MQKRISALLLAVVIVIGSVLGGNTLKVKAASVAVSEEFAVELTMMLYNLLETVAISSGIKDGLDDYESGSSLYDAFIASMESMAEPPFYDTIITQPDGSQVTVKEALDAVESTLGSNALKLPTSETFAKYRVISGTGGNDPEPTPTPEPENTPTPDPGYTDPFRYIQDVLVTSTLFTAMAGFFADLYDGNVKGLTAEDYYTGLGFSGFVFNPDGTFTPLGYIKSIYGNGEGYYLYTSAGSFYGADKYPSLSHIDKPAVAYIENSSMKFVSGAFPYVYQRFEGNVCKYTSDHVSVGNGIVFDSYYVNFPVFDSSEHANAYLKSESLIGLLNGEAYDFPELTKSVPTVMQPLTGYEFAPGRLPGINAALSTAAAALSEPGLDPAENTEAYKKTLNAALTAALPEPAPEPEPDPDPSPSPDPGTGGEGESYKRDLRLLFPFCIPFDFIHLIQALKAEPETPKFEIPVKLDFVDVDTSIVIDLAWMDPIMKIWRLGELGLFIVMLMKSTSKVIRW